MLKTFKQWLFCINSILNTYPKTFFQHFTLSFVLHLGSRLKKIMPVLLKIVHPICMSRALVKYTHQMCRLYLVCNSFWSSETISESDSGLDKDTTWLTHPNAKTSGLRVSLYSLEGGGAKYALQVKKSQCGSIKN